MGTGQQVLGCRVLEEGASWSRDSDSQKDRAWLELFEGCRMKLVLSMCGNDWKLEL